MKSENPISQNWDDLVFENRNQEYGAYVVRKSYEKNVSEAVLGSLAITMLLLLSPYALSFLGGKEVGPPSIIVDPGVIISPPPVIELDPKIITHPTPHIEDPRRFTVTTLPVADEPVRAAQQDSRPGEAGDNGSVISSASGPVSTGIETGAVVETPPILDIAEVMPAYEGGVKAMMKFIQKKVKYPPVALHTNTEGTVFVRFVVNFEGHVVDVEVVKGISSECDKEAARVIAMMASWKPGLQNKKPVSVRMVLPIKFMLTQ